MAMTMNGSGSASSGAPKTLGTKVRMRKALSSFLLLTHAYHTCLLCRNV